MARTLPSHSSSRSLAVSLAASAIAMVMVSWGAKPAAAEPIEGLDALYPSLDALYQDLHRNPELSLHEQRTAAKMAAQLRALGFEVTENVGGNGVVGVLKNGR